MRSLAMAAATEVSPLQTLGEALDQLEREDPLDMSSGALGQQIDGLVKVMNRLAAALTRQIAVFDRTHGCAAFDAHSTAAWLRQRVRLSPNAASEQVRVARQLDRLPQVGRAFAAGEVGFQHAAVMTRVLDEAPAEVAREAEPALLQVARRVDPHRLGMLTRHLRHTFAPEAVLDEAGRNYERQRLSLSESMDGLYYLDGVLDTEGGALLRTALDAIMGPPARDDGRPPTWHGAEALKELARRQLDAGDLPRVGGQRPHLTLTADVATLARLPGSRQRTWLGGSRCRPRRCGASPATPRLRRLADLRAGLGGRRAAERGPHAADVHCQAAAGADAARRGLRAVWAAGGLV